MTADPIRPTADALLAEGEWLRALARSLVVDPGTADDVAQDAAILALTRPPRDGGALRGWLRRVAANVASNARRREARRVVRERAVARDGSECAADEVVARWEVRRSVVDAVLALEEPYRATILVRYFDGLTAAEAASRLGVPVETVRTRTRRGLEILRARLARLDERRGRRAVLLLLALPDRGEGTGSALVTGGVLVGATAKWVAAAAVALVAIGATWTLVGDRSSEKPADATLASAQTEEPAAPRVRVRADTAAETAAADPGAGIDLDACDRERDLHGVVLGPDGAPVAGAKVTLLRKRGWGVTLQERSPAKWYFELGQSTHTGADGTFRHRLRPAEETGLQVEADGFADWVSRSRQAGERVTIRLARAVTLDVRVRKTDTTPVAGAGVRCSIDGDDWSIRPLVSTDALGCARIQHLPRGAKAFVFVVAGGSTHAQREVTLGDADSQTIDLVLPEGRTVRGVVTDARTKVGIRGARVGVGIGEKNLTDALGRFTVTTFGNSSIEAEADGYARCDVHVDGERDVVVTLEPATRLTGCIVDASGTPLASADVAVIGNPPNNRGGTSSVGGATTGPDGKFDIGGLIPSREHLLRVEREGHALHSGAIRTPDDAGGVHDVGNVVLVPPRTLRGVVLDAEGQPAATALRVDLAGPDGDGDFVTHLKRITDDLGRFAFADLPPGTYTLRVSGVKTPFEAVVPADADPAPITLATAEVAIEARPAIPVRVRIADEQGAPVEGVVAYVGYAANGASVTSKTDGGGGVLLNAEFEPAMVYVRAPDESSPWLPSVTWLRPGAREAAIVLRRAALISGRVVDADGKPRVGAWVEAFVGAAQVTGAISDAEGRFVLRVAQGGSFDLQASIATRLNDPAPRRSAEARGVSAGAQDVTLVMAPTGEDRSVTVEVVDAEGDAIEGAYVYAHFVGEDWMKPVHGATGADGVARIEGLPRSSVTFGVRIQVNRDEPNRHWSLCAQRVGTDASKVRFLARAPRVVRGRVVGDDGTPMTQGFVHASLAGLQNCMSPVEADGRFELRVPPEVPLPLPVFANPAPLDPKKPRSGYDLIDADDRELTIVLRDVPAR